jgi:hypothetical protein
MFGALAWMADLVLVLHAAFVLFVVGGLVAIWVGNALGYAGVNGLVFRIAHAVAIGIVVGESWLGIVCPLTRLEQALRLSGGAPGLDPGEGFVEHWVSRLLFYDLPPVCFTFAYSAFGLAVLATWWRWPPTRRGPRHSTGRC